MSAWPGLAVHSLWNRRGTAALTVFAIAVSVALLLGVQKLRTAAKESFATTISGTDLIVGARSGPINLLLYSVFRIGDPTANVTWETYGRVAQHRDVAWTIPLSLGDSHRGFRVVGTNGDYFAHYRYAQRRALRFEHGRPFVASHQAVLGHAVARELQYSLGETIVLSHGVGAGSFVQHERHPFRVVGILAPTGTPVDRAIHVDLESIDAIHGDSADTRGGEPSGITAFLVGMKSRDTVLLMQRALNEYRGEPLQAVIPGVALAQLWSIVGIADRALLIVAACVALAGLLGMLAAILTSLNERRREMAILRSVGAHPRHVFGLLVLEAGVLALAGAACGTALAYAAMWLAQPWFSTRYGIHLVTRGLTATDGLILAAVVAAALLLSALPAWRAYRNSLTDGMTVRL